MYLLSDGAKVFISASTCYVGEQQAKAIPLYLSWVDKDHAPNGWPACIALSLLPLLLSFIPGVVFGEIGIQYVPSIGMFLICLEPLN